MLLLLGTQAISSAKICVLDLKYVRPDSEPFLSLREFDSFYQPPGQYYKYHWKRSLRFLQELRERMEVAVICFLDVFSGI